LDYLYIARADELLRVLDLSFGNEGMIRVNSACGMSANYDGSSYACLFF
jgi:hypothetical protein